MGDEITKSPHIRFAGFIDAWEQRKLGDLADIVRGASPRPIQDPKWFDVKSEVGWLRISDVTEQEGRIFYLEQRISKLGQQKTRVLNEPHLLLSIAATVGKPVVNYVKTGVHDGFLIFLNPKFEREFMFQWLEMFRPMWQRYGQPGSQVNLNSDLVKNQEIVLPSIEEQIKIGEFLSQFDNLITLHQRKLELLKVTKKSMLQKMFPNDGESVPEIRFAGFTDAWEQCKLGDYIIPYNDVTTENNQYPVFTSSRKGLYFQTDYYDGNQIASEDNTGYNIVPRGYFTYRHMSDDLVFKFNINNLADNGIVSTLYPVFTTTESLDSKYLQYQLNEGEEFKRFAILQKQGGSRTYMYLSKLKDMILTMPILDEQIKISTFFKQLDDTITLHQRKLDLLKDLKKSMLKQMFI